MAAAVGVNDPKRVRLLLVDRVPIPCAALLAGLARRLGLPGPDVDGFTLGDTIFIQRDAHNLSLLAHECRHVRQFEEAGSLYRFLRQYLSQVARHGYHDAPLEADARAAARQWARQSHGAGSPFQGGSGTGK